ncbi:NAD-P-binding protein [Auriscalpium vulgare]|uniref:NAD-P-binding protein n=1 Tax=Auriscalpium vulgare TaxID=40419 RepID=A0ACB8S3U7_9AGAM|nr:NAD-P-binding protein [Auriscalpium vulgare]
MSLNSLAPPEKIGLFGELFPPKPHWTTAQVPDLAGQIIIVTGGNSGIGKESCRVLLSRNAKVYLAARSESKSQQAIEDLKKQTGKDDVHFLQLDLADLSSVRKAAEEYCSKETELHVLLNNGGVMTPPLDLITAQGYDGQFGTNVLGHFFFIQLLLPTILRTAKGETSGKPFRPRIVNVSSNGHVLFKVPGGVQWDTLLKGDESLSARKKLGVQGLYGQSKLGNVLLTKELAARYGMDGVVAISLHPGSIKTELGRHVPALMRRLTNWLLYDVSYGAITQLYAATSLDALEMNGEYLTTWARRQLPSTWARDEELRQKVWAWCEEQVKGF